MALTREQKESVVAEITDILNNAKSVVFLNFSGLDVTKTTNMRAKLGSESVKYLVAKKTLTTIAIKNSDVEISGNLPEMTGELAIAYTNGDETAAAREIYSFQNEYEDSISIQAGVFEGKLLGQADMMEIAQIPSMFQLRGMFVNLINSPIQRIATVLDQIAAQKTA